MCVTVIFRSSDDLRTMFVLNDLTCQLSCCHFLSARYKNFNRLARNGRSIITIWRQNSMNTTTLQVNRFVCAFLVISTHIRSSKRSIVNNCQKSQYFLLFFFFIYILLLGSFVRQTNKYFSVKNGHLMRQMNERNLHFSQSRTMVLILFAHVNNDPNVRICHF